MVPSWTLLRWIFTASILGGLVGFYGTIGGGYVYDAAPEGNALSIYDSICDFHMPSETTVSRGFLTVVPKEVRRAADVREGDVLEWTLEHGRILVRPRRRRTIDDITGLISSGGDAVASKRRLQRGRRDRR